VAGHRLCQIARWPALPLACVLGAAAPPVVAVTPSGDTVPERLLRITVTFAAPSAVAAPETALRRDDGSVIGGALLTQPLWSPDRRKLTLLLAPGRVKTGLVAHDTQGWALAAGSGVTLWVQGAPAHHWTVVAGGCQSLAVPAWHIEPPAAGSRAPLAVSLNAAVDGVAVGLIAIAQADGWRVAGAASLTDAERRWAFVPDTAWAAGHYRLVVHPRLETPCGDEAGDLFEHPAGSSATPAVAAPVLDFVIE